MRLKHPGSDGMLVIWNHIQTSPPIRSLSHLVRYRDLLRGWLAYVLMWDGATGCGSGRALLGYLTSHIARNCTQRTIERNTY